MSFHNVVQLKDTPDLGRHPSPLYFVHNLLQGGIDKIL